MGIYDKGAGSMKHFTIITVLLAVWSVIGCVPPEKIKGGKLKVPGTNIDNWYAFVHLSRRPVAS